MATLTLTPSDGGFPNPFSGTLQDMIDAYNLNLRLTIDTDNLILGQVGGVEPLTNVGPWLNGTSWEAWNGSSYSPTILKVAGNSGFTLTLTASSLTANRTMLLPDKAGTVAYQDDLHVPRDTIVILNGGNIDWSASETFYESMTANSAHTFTNSLAGQTITMAISHPSGTAAATFPSNVIWESPGTAPTSSGTGKTDLWFFRNVAGTIYGSIIKDFNY